jgi:hypothetical protein
MIDLRFLWERDHRRLAVALPRSLFDLQGATDGITMPTTSAGLSSSATHGNLGFEIEAIRALLTIQDNPDQSCEAVDVIARARLGEVERRIESLAKLKAELERMITACSRGRVAECRVIETLATPQPW